MQGYDLYIQCNAGIVKSLLFNGGGNGPAAMKSESANSSVEAVGLKHYEVSWA